MKKIFYLLITFLLLTSCAGLQSDIKDATLSADKWSSYDDYDNATDGAIENADTLMIRDTSDTSMAATGTQKELPWSEMVDELDLFDEVGFPYGTNPSVTTNGQSAIDSTDSQLLWYSGGELRVTTWKHRECFTLEDPVDADDNVPIFHLNDGFTVTRLDCIVKGGTSAVMVLNDGTNNLDSQTCGTTMTSDSSLSNATFTALEVMELDVGTVTGVVNWVSMCFEYKITRE